MRADAISFFATGASILGIAGSFWRFILAAAPTVKSRSPRPGGGCNLRSRGESQSTPLLIISLPGGMLDNKVDKVLVLKPSGPHVMTLISDDLEGHLSPEVRIPF